MRTIVTSFLLLAAAPWVALAQQPPPSAANVVRLHPGPWRMPGTVVMGMRFDPENGEAFVVEGTPGAHALALSPSQAEARVLAAQNATRHADGSRHAVVGNAFRSCEVVTVEADGRLTEDCVSTEAEAMKRVEAGAPKQVRK